MDTINRIALFIVVMIVGFLYRRFMDKYETDQQIQDLYIINKELLGKSKKPIMWISVPKYRNSRKWDSFYSRNNDKLNIPYMYLTIKSIISECGNDFTICIIDDNSFANLLPNWTPNLEKIGDPLREKIRYLGIMQLLYHYGGAVVPSSFLCLKNLGPLYNYERDHRPIVAENVNYYGDSQFAPDPHFIMAHKKCPIIESYVSYLARMTSNDYTAESIFLNDISKWCALQCDSGRMRKIDASLVGVKNIRHQPVVVDILFEEKPLDVSDQKYGILIPHEQIAKRTSLNWLCYIDTNELCNLNTELGYYFNKVTKL